MSITNIRRRLRKVADLGTDTDKDTVPNIPKGQALERKKVQVVNTSVKKLLELTNRIVMSLSFIESPVQKALNQALTSAKETGDANMAAKAKKTFHQMFGELYSANELIHTQLDPIIASLEQQAKGPIDPKTVNDTVSALTYALPVVRSAFLSLAPDKYVAEVKDELARQVANMEKLNQLAEVHKNNPGLAKKVEVYRRNAGYFIDNLKILVDPEYTDRVQNNVERVTKQVIPAIRELIKMLSSSSGQSTKTGSLQTKSRLNKVAKKIIMLSYIHSKIGI